MKKLVIALMAFALVITLAGCGGGGGGGSSVDPNIATYNGLAESEAFQKDTTCEKIRNGLADMKDSFSKSDLSGTQKKNVLAKYISDSFKNTTKANSSKSELLSTMESRFNRYTVNEWGFKVSNYSKNPENDPTEIQTECSIRLNLSKKPGADGSVDSWNSAVINRTMVWVKENGEWKIKSGFPYDRNTDF